MQVLHTHTSAHTYTYTCKRTCTCTRTCTHTRTHTHTSTHTHLHTSIHAHTHRHTHTHTLTLTRSHTARLMAFRLTVASSSVWPPLRNMMPGIAAGTTLYAGKGTTLYTWYHPICRKKVPFTSNTPFQCTYQLYQHTQTRTQVQRIPVHITTYIHRLSTPAHITTHVHMSSAFPVHNTIHDTGLTHQRTVTMVWRSITVCHSLLAFQTLINTHTHKQTHKHAHTHKHTLQHTHTHAHTQTNTHTSTHIHAQTHTAAYTHAHTHTHAQTHTAAHTHCSTPTQRMACRLSHSAGLFSTYNSTKMHKLLHTPAQSDDSMASYVLGGGLARRAGGAWDDHLGLE